MKKKNVVRFVSIGGILTAIAVIFQSAPVFLPAIGLALSPFSTLPIALAAVYNSSLGITVLFSSTLILMLISPQEAFILLFMTGILGMVLGTLLNRKGMMISTLLSGIVLTLGMSLLTYFVGFSPFGDLMNSVSTLFTILLYFLFSLIYAFIWNIGLKKFKNHFMKFM